MKSMKKILCAALAALMILGMAACGSAAPATTTAAPETTAAPADTTAAPETTEAPEETTEAPSEMNMLEQIKASGVLTVALSPDFAPMEFVDISQQGQDQYVGFDVTLAKYIAAELGVELEINAMNFDACQTAVYLGDVSMSISGFSWTATRAENYEMSDYYYAGDNETDQVILLRAEDAEKYTKPEDFDGVDIGAQIASLQMDLVTAQLPNANPVTIGDIGTGILELKSGNIEAMAVAKGNAEAIMVNNPELVICSWQFEVAEEFEANVILIQKGQTELLAAVNEILAKAYDAGVYGQWYDDAVALSKGENAQEISLD